MKANNTHANFTTSNLKSAKKFKSRLVLLSHKTAYSDIIKLIL